MEQAGTVPMTPAVPDAALASPVGNRRWRLVVVVVVVLGAVGLLAFAGLNRTLVYYRTPTELVRDPSLVGQVVRVGGLVAVGSLRRDGPVARFTLTDGATDLPVVFTGPIDGVFTAGRNALVEGRYTPAGELEGDALMVKHDNTYRGPGGLPYTSPTGPADELPSAGNGS